MKVERNSTAAERAEFRAEKLSNKANYRMLFHTRANDPKALAQARLGSGSIAQMNRNNFLPHEHKREIARRARQSGATK